MTSFFETAAIRIMSGVQMYLFNVPYGVGKAGCDRMASDCAKELREDHVAIVSLWPGPVKTEFMQDNIINSDSKFDSKDRIVA